MRICTWKKNNFILLQGKIKRCAVLLQSFTFPMPLRKLLNHKSTVAEDQVENKGAETTTEATHLKSSSKPEHSHSWSDLWSSFCHKSGIKTTIQQAVLEYECLKWSQVFPVTAPHKVGFPTVSFKCKWSSSCSSQRLNLSFWTAASQLISSVSSFWHGGGNSLVKTADKLVSAFLSLLFPP